MSDQPTPSDVMKDFDATTEQMIVRMSKQIDRWMQYKNKVFPVLRDWEKDTDKEKSIDDITFANDILSFAIHLSFIYCDLATAVRHYRTAKLNYEKRYAVKHINVIMVEGYRSIYGYSTDEKKKSFWNKSIKSICESISSECVEKYKNLTDKIIKIGETGMFDRKRRNLSVHYDIDVEKTYSMLLTLDADFECLKAIEFMALTQQLWQFSTEILELKDREIASRPNEFDAKMEEIMQSDKIPDVVKAEYKKMMNFLDELPILTGKITNKTQ